MVEEQTERYCINCIHIYEITKCMNTVSFATFPAYHTLSHKYLNRVCNQGI